MADRKISQFGLMSAAEASSDDSLPICDESAGGTPAANRRLRLRTLQTLLGGTDASVENAVRAEEAASSAATAAVQAGTDADRAELAASVATTSARFFDSIALGRAGVADGQTFGVRAGGTDGLIRPTLFRRDSASTQTEVGGLITNAQYDAVLTTYQVGAVGTNPLATSLSTYTILIDTAATVSCALATLEVSAVAAGTIYVQVWRANGDGTHTCISETPKAVVVGRQTLTFASGEVPVPVGHRVGIRPGVALHRANGYTGLNVNSTANTVGSTITPATSTAVLYFAIATLESGGVIEAVLSARAADARAGRGEATLGTILGGPETLNLATTPGAGSSANANMFVRLEPLTRDAYIDRLDFHMMAAGPVLFRVFDMVATGGGAYAMTEVRRWTLQGAIGLNTVQGRDMGDILLKAGQVIGVSGVGMSYVGGAGYPGYSGPSAASFTVAALANISPVMQYRLRLADAEGYLGRDADLALKARSVQHWLGPLAVRDLRWSLSGLTLNLTAALSTAARVSPVITASLAIVAPGAAGRYTLVHYNPVTGVVAVTHGSARDQDAQGYRPTAPDGTIPLLLLRVSTTAIVQVLEVWRLARNGLSRPAMPFIHAARDDNRAMLPRTLGKIARRAALKILSIGDSITQIGPNTAASLTAPNGANRDRSTYLSGFTGYQSDYIATVPTYTPAQMGRAAESGTDYVRLGAIWSLIAALEAKGYVMGTDLDYQNFAVSGRKSTDVVSEAGVMTAWGTAALAVPAVDLVVIAFGMNERGETGTAARLTHLARAFRTAGTEVILTDTPRARANTGDDAAVITTRAQTAVAARATGSALVSWGWIDHPDVVEARGVADIDVCGSNLNNHPGPEELAAFGRLLVASALGT